MTTVLCSRLLKLQTVSFGGYDKKATETFILEEQKKYEDEINQLKADAEKLSEAVKGLQQMRETGALTRISIVKDQIVLSL